MLNKSVARRYAESLFAIAVEQNQVDKYEEALNQVADTIASHEELKNFMAHVLIPPQTKKDAIARIFADKIEGMVLNFINLVIDKRRADYLIPIYNEFKDMADESRNILKAEIISAKNISEQDVAELERSLSAATGKNVKITLSIDPSLIGGVKVRIGDQILDASVAKKLERLKSTLVKVKIS